MDTQESEFDWKMWTLRVAMAVLVVALILFMRSNGGFASAVLVLIVAAAVLLLYFLPTFFAFDRNHLNKKSIFILNLTLGWLLIPWVIALVWAFKNDGVVRNVIDQSGVEEERFRRCPYCAEEVRAEAIKCKHCQSELMPIQ